MTDADANPNPAVAGDSSEDTIGRCDYVSPQTANWVCKDLTKSECGELGGNWDPNERCD